MQNRPVGGAGHPVDVRLAPTEAERRATACVRDLQGKSGQ